MGQDFLELREVVDFDLDFDEMAHAFARRRERGTDATCRDDVVILDQHRVVEPEAVIRPAARAHGVLLEGAQAG